MSYPWCVLSFTNCFNEFDFILCDCLVFIYLSTASLFIGLQSLLCFNYLILVEPRFYYLVNLIKYKIEIDFDLAIIHSYVPSLS